MMPPICVDFAGGGLDVPAHAVEGAFIVNCALQPHGFPAGCDTGWQDVVISETGLCIWRSGPLPVLDFKSNPDWLNGLMALWPSGDAGANVRNLPRNYHEIAKASYIASDAVRTANLTKLAEAINLTHNVQLQEGMEPLPSTLRSIAYKYVGSGHGGYALYLFNDRAQRDDFCKHGGLPVEPFLAVKHGVVYVQ